MPLTDKQVEECPIDHTPTTIVDGIEVCERGHKWAPTDGVFQLIAPQFPPLFVVHKHRQVMHGAKVVCRAASEQWAKRISKALNKEQERKP